MDFHSILGKLRAIESLGRRDSVFEAEKCNMTAEGEMCPVHGMEECAGYQGTIQMEDSRGEMMDEESDHERDERAEKAGRKVAHDIEYDEKHKDHIHGHKRGSEDDKAERAGRKVADEIEHDEMHENMEESECNMTAEGEMCPVHGMEECWTQGGMEEDAALGGFPFTPIGATNNGPDTQGFVYAYNESQKQLRESMNIVMNQTIGDGQSTRSVTVTATDNDANDLVRLLVKAGLAGGNDAHQDAEAPTPGMPYGVAHAVPVAVAAMENADYDHGHDEHPEAGEPLEVKDYEWDGPHINQRFGKIGDNTLMAERADSLFAALNEEYTSFLAEAELAPSNASGAESPLTANARDAFDKDPFADEEPVTDGSRSPLSHIGRQDVMN